MALSSLRKPLTASSKLSAHYSVLIDPSSVWSPTNHHMLLTILQPFLPHLHCHTLSEAPINKFLDHLLSNKEPEMRTSVPSTSEKSCVKTKSLNGSIPKKEKFILKERNIRPSTYIPKKDNTVQMLMLKGRHEEVLKFLASETNLSKYSFDFETVDKLCYIASLQGSVGLVKKILKNAFTNFYKPTRQLYALQSHLATAEFHAGNHIESLDLLSDLHNAKEISSKYLHINSPYSETLSYPQLISLITSEIYPLRNVTLSILQLVPEVQQDSVWNKAEDLVKDINKLHGFSLPAFTLWKGYFFSPLQPEFTRADSLYELVGVQRLAMRELRCIATLLLKHHNIAQVEHFLQLLLKYEQQSALSPISCLLLSMQCNEGNWRAALEVLHFATSLKLMLSYNSLMRLQQLLHQRRVPIPEQLMHLKAACSVTQSATRNSAKKPPIHYDF
ncbi:uncharacterized protein LOC108677934 [Hyalella azteca]|uniref:Uncharacterized protein LOC108677934 n=1 Tax=Hyalella azteca TaxID=294128 RepID=A0A8B7P6Z2_HYAAZ|nr:uncharacterized protein LOC108677934 [Hyalella azteca]